MDFHDMNHTSNNGNKLFLVVIDRATSLLFAFSMPFNAALGIARVLLGLCLIFVVPVAIRSAAEGEFTAQVYRRLYQ